MKRSELEGCSIATNKPSQQARGQITSNSNDAVAFPQITLFTAGLPCSTLDSDCNDSWVDFNLVEISFYSNQTDPTPLDFFVSPSIQAKQCTKPFRIWVCQTVTSHRSQAPTLSKYYPATAKPMNCKWGWSTPFPPPWLESWGLGVHKSQTPDEHSRRHLFLGAVVTISQVGVIAKYSSSKKFSRMKQLGQLFSLADPH